MHNAYVDFVYEESNEKAFNKVSKRLENDHNRLEKIHKSVEKVRLDVLKDYANPDHPKYEQMVKEIGKRMGFNSLKYHRLDDLIEAIGLEPCKLCTYCFNGKE